MPTLGERRVRTEFNPSKDTLVDQIKQKSAELIDLCESIVPQKWEGGIRNSEGYPEKLAELRRLASLAQTHYEDAAMWAVKAATA